MQLVILAAGKGIRLGDDAKEIPKSLVEALPGRLYLSLQLQAFSTFPFTKKIIVGGYAIDKLNEFLSQNGKQDCLLIDNKDFHKGNLYSFKAALPELNDDFFIFNADHYYSPENYEKIFSVKTEQITIFCDQDRILCEDDMKVDAFGNELVSMSKQMKKYDYGYVGITYVPISKQALYKSALQEVENLHGDSANVELVLNQLAKSGEGIALKDISGSWWTEIDTPEDLQKARDVIKAHAS